MERQIEREQARARPAVERAALEDPQWQERAQAAWKRLKSLPDDRAAATEFDELLKQKGLL